MRSLREQQDHARQEQDKLQQSETALVQAIDRHPALEQEALDRFAAAVRHCRTLRSGIAAETVRQEGLSQQAQQLERPLTGGSLPLLCMGIVLLLPGLVLLLAGQWAPELLPWPGLAASPWAGGLAAVCGLALLAGGLPHAGKAERHRREEAARIRQLLEESTGRLREQQHRLARLPLPRTMNNDIPDADELESCLEKQQAARRQLDQLLQEHDSLRQELRRVRQTLARLAEQEQELLAAIQDGENRWQAMLPAATATAFAPAAAGLLFERAASAATLAEALRAAGDDAGHATSSLQQTEQALRDLLALLPPDAACPSLPEAVRRGLALCREAEEARAGHQQAAAEAATSAGLLERCRKVLEDSRCRTQEAALRLETARDRLDRWPAFAGPAGRPDAGDRPRGPGRYGELFAPRRRAATGRFAPATSARRNRSPAGTAGRPAGRDGTPRTAAGCRLAPASGNAGRGGGGRPPPCRRAGPPAPAAG